MPKNIFNRYFFILLINLFSVTSYCQQVLTMKEAIDLATKNYGTLKAKSNYVKASQATVEQTKKEYLPDLNLSAQQDYGTINGQNGVLYGLRGLAASPGGPALDRQNWNSAFGSLYLTNINWDFFSFGKAHEKVQVAKANVTQDVADLQQEYFQHEVRVASAYLNLLAAQRITTSQEKNLDRVKALTTVVLARTKNGLNAGVDSSLANAEVSNAKILLTRAKDNEQEQSNQLSILLDTTIESFTLDTLFINQIPGLIDTVATYKQADHPLLKYYLSRIDVSNARLKYYNTFKYPTFTAFGIIQGRGSGFNYNYNSFNNTAFNKNYFQGVKPTRANYLVGIGVTWNLSNYLRINQQLQAQKFTTAGLQNEYDVVDHRLKNQLLLAQKKMENALQIFSEVPVEIKAATDAYVQKSVLYKNGLSNIIDITQALFALNRAETDRDIAYNNIWQALLYKAAASGDLKIFLNGF